MNASRLTFLELVMDMTLPVIDCACLFLLFQTFGHLFVFRTTECPLVLFVFVMALVEGEFFTPVVRSQATHSAGQLSLLFV